MREAGERNGALMQGNAGRDLSYFEESAEFPAELEENYD